jgi:hypothetical protein
MSETNSCVRPGTDNHPDRKAFEAWFCKSYNSSALQPMENGCYLNSSAGMAWDAWCAARPNRKAISSIFNVASALAQRTPLSAFGALEDATHIGHRQFSRAYEQADEDTRLLACKLSDAIRAI